MSNDNLGDRMNNFITYKYGLLPPTENADLVHSRFRLAHQYRNTLNEIECGRRAAVRLLTRENDENIRQLESDLLSAQETEKKIAVEIKSQHSQMRSRLSTQTDKEDFKVARGKCKECKRLLNEARHLLKSDPKISKELELINERAKQLIHSAREYCGVYWGTYLLVEDAMDKVRKMPLYDGVRDNNPKYVSWKQEGSIGVQIQGGLDAKDIFRGNTQIRIDTINDKAFYADTRSERKKAQRTVLHIRIGSTKGQPDKKGKMKGAGKPIWASFPMVMHRPLPDGAVIKTAKVHLKRVANCDVWEVDMSVDISKCLVPTSTAKGSVSIDLGWREMKDKEGKLSHYRISTYCGEDKQLGEIKLSPDIVSGIRKASELKSVRDDNFNLIRKELVISLKDNEAILPEWLKSYPKINSLSHWRSIAQLVSLVKYWSANRFDGDKDIFGAQGVWDKKTKVCPEGTGLAGWRYHDDHLWNWEYSQREKALKRRREFYRVEAAKLAKQYQTLVLEDFDLCELSQKAEPDAKEDNQKGRSNRTLCAPDEWRQVLENAFANRNGKVIKIDPKGTSYTCALCQSKEHLDHETHMHTCNSCKETWDRDENAAKNILALGLCEQSGDAQTPEGARSPENGNDLAEVAETRHQRRNRAKLENAARAGTAREAEDNVA